MAKTATKRQQPSKPTTLKREDDAKVGARGVKVEGDHEAERQTRTAAEDNAKARDLAPTHDIQGEHDEQKRGERSKEEIEAGKKKGKYEVLTEGAIFDGETKCKMGDVVTLTADQAAEHQKRGVGLVAACEKNEK